VAGGALSRRQQPCRSSPPELLFDGFIDQATIDLDKGRDDLEYTVISAFDYFFEDGEGQRLNGQFHHAVWPGEKGLDNVTGVTKKIYWGALGPNSGPSRPLAPRASLARPAAEAAAESRRPIASGCPEHEPL
jgi:hypothetical protein